MDPSSPKRGCVCYVIDLPVCHGRNQARDNVQSSHPAQAVHTPRVCCRAASPALPAVPWCCRRSTLIHLTPEFYVKPELVGARPLHLAYARPFGRLKAPLGLSLLRFAAQTRTTLFLLCTKSCIVWRKIGVWCSFRWKSIKRKSPKLLGTSRSFRLCFAQIGNLLLNRLHHGENANNDSIFIRYAPLTSLIDAEETKEKLPLYSKFLSMMSDSYATELRFSKKSSASNTVEKVTQYLQSH